MLKRFLNKKSKLERSRGVVLTTGQADSAPNYSSGSSSVPVVKTTTGSRFLGFDFLFKNLLNILPLFLFFSYYPVITLGRGEAMNFELSLPLIWLVVFDTVAVVLMIKRRILWKGLKGKWWLWVLLPVWLTVSALWSLNFVRGLLTVGILWLIYIAGYGMWQLKGLLDAGFRRRWWKWFFGATFLVCAWCVVQCMLDVAGVPRECTLLCPGCTYHMFGFPHPNGFAIEPQFMGNLLLAPAIVTAWIYLKKHNSKNLKLERSRGVVLTTGQADSAPNYSSGSSSVPVVKTTTGSRFLGSKFLLLCFFIISMTLFLTFSRGAIYAFIVAMVFMSVTCRPKRLIRDTLEGARPSLWSRVKRFRALGTVWLIIICAFVCALNLQGVMAQVSPTNDTYTDGVAKVVNQLSLGVIDIRGDEVVEKPVENPEDNRGGGTDENGTAEPEEIGALEESDAREEAVFDGYVAESTDTRLRLTGAAVTVWKRDFKTAIFGVGLGGAGWALYAEGLSPAPKEIVQNEYASLLLETGIVGIVLLILTLVLVIKVMIRSSASGALLALLVAYGVTLLFFSGLPNALQIYLMPVVLMVIMRKKINVGVD